MEQAMLAGLELCCDQNPNHKQRVGALPGDFAARQGARVLL